MAVPSATPGPTPVRHRFAFSSIPLAFLLSLSLLLLLSCATPSPPPVLVEVPFLPQSEGQCGPVALLMVAHRYGLSPDPGLVRSKTFVPALGGTPPELLWDAAPDAGLARRATLPATAEDPSPLFAALDKGCPVILFLNPPPLAANPDLGHYAVATGYNPRTRALRVHSGDTPNRWLPVQSWLPRLAFAFLFAP